jgi:hypothetical protein
MGCMHGDLTAAFSREFLEAFFLLPDPRREM